MCFHAFVTRVHVCVCMFELTPLGNPAACPCLQVTAALAQAAAVRQRLVDNPIWQARAAAVCPLLAAPAPPTPSAMGGQGLHPNSCALQPLPGRRRSRAAATPGPWTRCAKSQSCSRRRRASGSACGRASSPGAAAEQRTAAVHLCKGWAALPWGHVPTLQRTPCAPCCGHLIPAPAPPRHKYSQLSFSQLQLQDGEPAAHRGPEEAGLHRRRRHGDAQGARGLRGRHRGCAAPALPAPLLVTLPVPPCLTWFLALRSCGCCALVLSCSVASTKAHIACLFSSPFLSPLPPCPCRRAGHR